MSTNSMSNRCDQKNHEDDEPTADELTLLRMKIRRIESSMPRDDVGDVDYEGHRRFHEEKVKALKAEEEFWQALKLEIVKKGVWSLLVILCGLVMLGLSVKLGIGFAAK